MVILYRLIYVNFDAFDRQKNKHIGKVFNKCIPWKAEIIDPVVSEPVTTLHPKGLYIN